MSSLVISGDTSGSVTLQAPAVSGTTTLTLPSVSGTVITTASSGQSIPKAALPTGSVLQVVNATYSTSTSSSSSTYADTGMSASITPTSSTNKILVFINHSGCRKDTSATALQLRLLRGASVITYIETNAGSTVSTATNNFGGSGIVYLDSPATTSSTTYKTQLASQNNTGTVYVNDSGGANNAVSSITLMEISA